MDPTEMSRGELIRYTLGMIRRYNIKPKHRLGQNFVVDPRLIKDMINAANLSRSDVVLEVGAGIGTLTIALARRCRKVIAVEIDKQMEIILEEVARREGNVEVVIADIMDIRIPKVDKVISNIPYRISSPFTEKLLREIKFNLAILTYQLEFARRLYAVPGSKDYGRITILAYYYAKIQPIRLVSPLSFMPRPKVFSEIVKITPRKAPPFKLKDEDFFFNLIRELFSQRRKTLRNSLRIALRNMNKDTRLLNLILRERGEITNKRVEELAPEELAKLANALWEVLSARG